MYQDMWRFLGSYTRFFDFFAIYSASLNTSKKLRAIARKRKFK